MLKPLTVMAFVVVAFVLFPRYLFADLYGDEWGHTWGVINAPDFWHTLAKPEMCHPPLFFILARYSYLAVGAPWAIRIPSLIFALLTIPFAIALGSRIVGKESWLWPGLLCVLSPFVLEFATEGRVYAGMVFFSTASVWAFERWMERESAGRLAVLTAFITGGCLLHYFFLFVPAALALVYLLRRRRVTRAWLAYAAVCGALFALFAMVVFVIQGGGQGRVLQADWAMQTFSYVQFFLRLAIAIALGYSTFRLGDMDRARNVSMTDTLAANALAVALLVVFAIALAITLWRHVRERRPGFYDWITAAAVITGLGVLANAGGFAMVREKHLAPLWVFFFLILLSLLWHSRKTLAGKALLASYAGLCLISVSHFVFDSHHYGRRMDWTGLIRQVEREAGPDDVVASYLFSLESIALRERIDLPAQAHRLLLGDLGRDDALLKGLNQSPVLSQAPVVFLVHNETEKNLLDPERKCLALLSQGRSVSVHPYGRNLALYKLSR